MKKKFNGYWYFYIHGILKSRSNDNYITMTEAKSCLFQWRIPEWLRVVVIKELENLDLLVIENKNLIRIKKTDVNLENTSKIFNQVGILEY